MAVGAFGFSTSRLLVHRDPDGNWTCMKCRGTVVCEPRIPHLNVCTMIGVLNREQYCTVTATAYLHVDFSCKYDGTLINELQRQLFLNSFDSAGSNLIHMQILKM